MRLEFENAVKQLGSNKNKKECLISIIKILQHTEQRRSDNLAYDIIPEIVSNIEGNRQNNTKMWLSIHVCLLLTVAIHRKHAELPKYMVSPLVYWGPC